MSVTPTTFLLDTMAMEPVEGLLDNVTFVVTVRERCKHLCRALDYYSRFPVRVLVMDSSDNACRVGRHPAEFRHLHFPQTFVVDAISKALAAVTTPYCVIVPDDDFAIPRVVAEAVRFLNANPDYQCAQGLYGVFKNTGEVELREAYPHMPGYEVAADAPQDRMIQHLSHYVTHFHAVHRTEYLRDAINSGQSVKNFSANEIVTGAVTAMGGKLKVLPLLYSVREVLDSSQSALLARGTQKVKFHAALSNRAEHAALINGCETVLCGELESRGLAPQDAIDSVRKAFEEYRRFVADFPLRSKQWQEAMRRKGTRDFAAVLSDQGTRADWATIKSIVVDHNLSPFVPALLVDDEGRRIRTWQDSPILFHMAVVMKKWSKFRILSRALIGLRSVLRMRAAR